MRCGLFDIRKMRVNKGSGMAVVVGVVDMKQRSE